MRDETLPDEDLAFLPIPALAAKLRGGEISSVELTRFYLGRLERIGLALNAVVTLMPEAALRDATHADAELAAGLDRGPLHGIPYGMKDIVAAIGAPTTWGAEPFRDRVISEDATVVRKLREAGAVLCTKLATVEMAGGMGYNNPNACLTGPCVNPWRRDTWTSGSSSGSCAAVASACVPFAIGSDTSGSILYPATITGVAGLRATFGRVGRSGVMTLCWTLDRLGSLCRTAEDCGLVLEAITGPDPRDFATLGDPYHYRRVDRRQDGFRFGLLKNACRDVEADVQANFETSVKLLAEIGSIEEAELPDFPYAEMGSIITAAEAYAAFDTFIESGRTAELTALRSHGHRLGHALLPAHDYIRAQRIRLIAQQAFVRLASRYDALIAPGLGVTASSIHSDFEHGLPRAGGTPINLAGVLAGTPTVSIFNGLSGDGLPTGIQFAGAPLAENAILDAARALEVRQGLQHLRPRVEEIARSVPSGERA
ncbi:amidase [Rhizobium binxianense]